MNVLLEVLTKDEETLTATEALICTDKPTEMWYVYYLEVELGKQNKNPFPYLNMEQIIEDVLDGGFNTGNDTLDGKLNGLISEEAWEKIDKMTSEEGMEEMFNKYLETGSTGDPEMDALLKEYLEKGTTGYEEVDKIINDYVDAGKMDEQMASMLVGNLIKNAFLYTPQGGDVSVTFSGSGFSVSNTGTAPLDKEKVFRRFYQPAGRREGATGLGLALVYSVCVNNGLDILYDFRDGRHIFEVFLKNSK
jgi:hypothetical protein